MCLLLVAVDVVPQRPLLLLGNRDEFHARASAPADVWSDAPEIVGGRDLEAGGSWLAMHRRGRFAAVTNIRVLPPQRGPRSRGDLVRDFVGGEESAAAFMRQRQRDVADYAPFNLVVADRDAAWCLHSPMAQATRLGAGVHVVSNGPLDAAWPKMQRLRARFMAALENDGSDAQLLDLLLDTALPPDSALPDTGVGLERERFLASIFIRGDSYGTRASTLAWRASDGSTGLQERRFLPDGSCSGESRIA